MFLNIRSCVKFVLGAEAYTPEDAERQGLERVSIATTQAVTVAQRFRQGGLPGMTLVLWRRRLLEQPGGIDP
jgi:hypothetical protein